MFCLDVEYKIFEENKKFVEKNELPNGQKLITKQNDFLPLPGRVT